MFDDAALFQQQDVVDVIQRFQPVRDDNPRSCVEQPLEGDLQQALSGRIQPRRRLVQQHQTRIAQQHTREG